MAEPAQGTGPGPIVVLPVVVVSQTFPARPSSIPDIRDFVRRCLADSPFTEEGNREVGETVFQALLDAAGATGSIQVSFRLFPDHVEVDVLHSDNQVRPMAKPATPGTPANLTSGGQGPDGAAASRPVSVGAAPQPRSEAVPSDGGEPATSFAEWMANALRREGLTQEQAARQLGVSVKTVSRWVGGATQPRMRDLRRIQERFGEVPLP